MSRKDIITKDYVKDSSIFADVFNNAIYKGRQVNSYNYHGGSLWGGALGWSGPIA